MNLQQRTAVVKALRSGICAFAFAVATFNSAAVAQDSAPVQVETLDQLGKELLQTPATPGLRERRQTLLLRLDEFLRKPNSECSEAVIQYYQGMIDHALGEVQSEKVEQGVVVWKFYSSSMVIKTPKTVFGVDLIEGPEIRRGDNAKTILQMTPQQRARLVSLVDISFHTHRHHDHINYLLTEELLGAGKTVVVPQDVRTMWIDKPIASKLTVLDAGQGTKHPVGTLKVEVFASQQWMRADSTNPCPCNAYLVTTDNGINVLFKGDINDGNDLLPWLKEIKARGGAIDLYVSSHFFWPGKDALPQIELMFDPFIIPGHEYEFRHRKRGEWGSGTGSYKLLFERFQTAIERGRCAILSWGEKFHYVPPLRNAVKQQEQKR